MVDSKPEAVATELSIMAVRLVRWLRATDPSPALSGPEASAMAVIVHAGGITPSQLAQLEHVRRPTISRLLDDLMRRGLITRDVHPEDKRSSIVTATQKGLDLWHAGQDRRVAPLAKRIAALGAEERRQLIEAMPLIALLTEPGGDD